MQRVQRLHFSTCMIWRSRMRTKALASKMEAYGDSLFIVLRTARWDDSAGFAAYGEIARFAYNYLVSVRHGASPDQPAGTAGERRQPQLLADQASLYADVRRRQLRWVLSAYGDQLDN